MIELTKNHDEKAFMFVEKFQARPGQNVRGLMIKNMKALGVDP